MPTPTNHVFRGFVDMHMPDAWGYLLLQQQQQQQGDNSSFSAIPDTTIQDERDALWPAKLTATTIYYHCGATARLLGSSIVASSV
jgi:pyrrolidone-carboxylate peptidase